MTRTSANGPRRSKLLAQARPGAWLHGPLPWLAVSALVALVCLRQVLKLAGVPSVPLDDAYIHFQYARSFLKSPFVFSPGAEATPGATSLLWPLLLAPAYGLGLKGDSIIWAAWVLGFVALGLLARETYLAARKFVSVGGAVAAGLATFAFAANVWFASSGMEVIPLAWLLTRAVRRAADWIEGEQVSVWELCALAWAAAAMRPEGALAACLIAAVLVWVPRKTTRRWAVFAISGIGLAPLVNYLATGQAAQTTSRVKWLPFSPYHDVSGLATAILDNVQLFVSTLLNGELWSSAFIPEGSRLIALCLLPALLVQGALRGVPARAVLFVILGIGMLIPATYDSFLWNRLRYLWPFSAAWLIGISAFAELIGEALSRVHAELRLVRTSLAFGFVAVLATKLPFAIEDLAQSADAITSQQVSLGRWAQAMLPQSAVIGVNDTGAVAYFSDKRTFDIVGLTTRAEAKYWVAGAGSRFEHYERLGERTLPTHFIVYSEWFGIPWLLSTCFTERIVPGRTILGGVRMVACAANYDVLGSGERPLHVQQNKPPIDVLDVADLESEAAHGYKLLPARQWDNVAISAYGAVDGARQNRVRERFVLALRPGGVIVARLGATEPTRVQVQIETRLLANLELDSSWQELEIDVPRDLAAGRYELSFATQGQPFTAFHYWSFAEH